MAVIGKIRQYSALVVFAIGASIVGFLIMDATNSQYSVLKGRKDWIGKVNGDKISYNEFTNKYEENVKNFEDRLRGQAIGDDQRNYLRTQTWNDMVNDIIFNRIYDQLGINVTPDELTELAVSVDNASPAIRQEQGFKNQQTGQFDPNLVRAYLSQLDQDPEGTEPGTRRKQWMNFEAMLKQNQFQQKYSNLINKGFYAPTWMAEMTYEDQNRYVNFKYVMAPFSDVNDADVKVTDDDIKKYIDDHAARFKQEEETRKISYVTFDIAPSPSDTAKTIEYLESKREEFAKGATPSDDSEYVKLYSETLFDDVYYDKDKLVSPVKDSLLNGKKGQLIGPYADGGSFKIAKISDKKMISDSVHIRQIKILFTGITTQEAAAVKFKFIDSIFTQIDSLKGNFAAFAAAYSDDEVSKNRGGDIGWVKQNEKVKIYNDLIFYHAQKGKLYKVPVQDENAIYLVEVIDDKPSKMGVEVAYLTKEIIPSPETEKNIYATATTFAADNQSEARFRAAGEKLHIKTVNALKKDAFNVEGLMGSAREVVRWAYTAKKGDVSPVFTVEKKHVVALLQDIRPKGLPEPDEVREQVKADIVKQKKFELLSKKITDEKAGSIDELASKLGKTVSEAEHVSFNNPSLNGAFEPKVAAVALSTAAGKMSQPVKGNTGVYVVQTISVQEPPKATEFNSYALQLKQQLQSKSRYAAEVEKKLAKIDDNRFDFF